jgi:hypothetical protein
VNFRDIVDHVARSADVTIAQTAIRAQHGTHAARWLADEAGISPRTARRWMSSAPPASRVPNIVNHAARNMVAAHIFRVATSIDVGVITVEYDQEDQGTRGPIGTVRVDTEVAGYLGAAASALEAQQYDAAAEDFSNAVVNGYEPGLEDALEIVDYDDVISVNY